MLPFLWDLLFLYIARDMFMQLLDTSPERSVSSTGQLAQSAPAGLERLNKDEKVTGSISVWDSRTFFSVYD